jgi:hypothetical protein
MDGVLGVQLVVSGQQSNWDGMWLGILWWHSSEEVVQLGVEG